MIFKIFSLNNSAKKLAVLTQNKAKLCKILIISLVFEKNAIFSPKIVENRRKLPKIVIITSPPGQGLGSSHKKVDNLQVLNLKSI
jgi:hypothetical protein